MVAVEHKYTFLERRIMKSVELFPPKGGDPVKAHPTQVEYMKSAGWTESPAKNVKLNIDEVNENG
jgi:hypothetical protein